MAVDAFGRRTEARRRVRRTTTTALERFRDGEDSFHVTGSIMIEPGQRLFIPPGSNVRFDEGVGLLPSGCHRA